MPRKVRQHTAKQKRQAGHIADSYEKRGVDKEEAHNRAWATVNKVFGEDMAASNSFSSSRKRDNHEPYKKSGRRGRKN